MEMAKLSCNSIQFKVINMLKLSYDEISHVSKCDRCRHVYNKHRRDTMPIESWWHPRQLKCQLEIIFQPTACLAVRMLHSIQRHVKSQLIIRDAGNRSLWKTNQRMQIHTIHLIRYMCSYCAFLWILTCQKFHQVWGPSYSRHNQTVLFTPILERRQKTYAYHASTCFSETLPVKIVVISKQTFLPWEKEIPLPWKQMPVWNQW